MKGSWSVMSAVLSVVGAVAVLGPDEDASFGGDASRCERVGGDMEATATLTDKGWRSGDCLIDTPLPRGYPAPTPPGAIEIKRYDSVRKAEVSTETSYGRGSNEAFWPLFQHIQSRGIAMTSPVEMEMPSWDGEASSDVGEWTMAFLYRTPELGETGEAGRVRVVDSETRTYLSIGVQGAYGMRSFAEAMDELEAWLASQEEWERAGGPRVLGYNGPMTPSSKRWAEVQVEVMMEE